MYVIEYYALLSPHIYNGPIHFVCEENKGGKGHATSLREIVSKYIKKERKKERKKEHHNVIYQTLIIYFGGIEGNKKEI